MSDQQLPPQPSSSRPPARVAESATSHEQVPEPAPLPVTAAPAGGRRWMSPVAISLMVLLALAILVGVARALREYADRIKCAANIRCLGQALMLYSNDFKTYPRTNYDPDQPLTAFTPLARSGMAPNETDPFFGPNRPANNDVSAALFMLVRTVDVSPDVFICPSTNHIRDTMNNSGAGSRVNFNSGVNLSYSYANPYPSQRAVDLGYMLGPSPSATFAIMADRNDGDLDANLSADSNSPSRIQRAMNSRNHGGDGQNVLYSDGHVEWRPTCWAGDAKDCIWGDAAGIQPGRPPAQAMPARTGNGVDPKLELDSILLPKKGMGLP